MKKLTLLIAALALLLTSCSGPTTSQGVACTNDSVGHLAWGQIVYTLPICWVSQQSGSDTLILTSEETKDTVTFQKTAPETQSASTQTFPLSTGEILYVTPSASDDWDTETILDSIKITSFNVAPGDCAAPDYDYPQSINYTWQGITFGLPFCWGAEESHTYGGDPQLVLYKQMDESNQYFRVNFWHESPLSEHYEKLEDTKIAGLDAEHYIYPLVEGTNDNSNIYVLKSDPVWYIETGNPDDYTVQSILASLTVVPVTFPNDQVLPEDWNGFTLPEVDGNYWCESGSMLLLSGYNPADFGVEYPTCAEDAPGFSVGSDQGPMATVVVSDAKDFNTALESYRKIASYTVGAVEDKENYQQVLLTYDGPGSGREDLFWIPTDAGNLFVTLDAPGEVEEQILNAFTQ